MLNDILTILILLGISLAAPAEISARATGEIQPDNVVFHSLSWGAWPNWCSNPNTWAFLYRMTQGGEYGQSGLYSFTVPQAAAGAQCSLEFNYVPGGLSNNNGVQVDVFSTRGPGSCAGTTYTNNRDQHLGRLNIPAGGGKATWAATYSQYLTSKQLCEVGKQHNIELVPVGDDTYVSFPQGTGQGVRLAYTT
ncbi:hypothetical protein MMYC01_207120 [Madurella mycetomatis]|uniref:Ubiquitin 3 binding protein But2 C-terminal domain-containing protein n=1 Tax=Madurella mycetomatis TaxID=100816 RepID=A0A175VXL4_9PEZI|nr:hypothetical protein MMYC01_207120 [Madurella mycetomatis]